MGVLKGKNRNGRWICNNKEGKLEYDEANKMLRGSNSPIFNIF